MKNLRRGEFTLAGFYERRARRILPAIMVVMALSSAFAYAWMLPDELENFGQSLVATSLFSNNILLTLTSGYWDLASEFKPLLHTWSLGVEEQFYVLFPLALLLAWSFARERLMLLLVLASVFSLAAAALIAPPLASASSYSLATRPWELLLRATGLAAPSLATASFYALPTRAWELLLGALAALYMRDRNLENGALASLGLAMIAAAVVVFDKNTPTPSLLTMVPAVGTLLVILYAREGSITHRVLSAKVVVGAGVLSYSAYLWHQPLFAFARVYSKDAPSAAMLFALCGLTFVLAWVTWRWVESPFRNRANFSRRSIFICAGVGSATLAGFGFFLHATHGAPWRVDESVAGAHIGYNQRVYRFKKERFDGTGLKVLIVGNSFARDFVNMTLETLSERNIDLIYRNDVAECGEPHPLLTTANVVVFASGEAQCPQQAIARARAAGQQLFYAGPKHFGWNLNWLARLDANARVNQWNDLPQFAAEQEERIRAAVPAEHFISLLTPISQSGKVPVTDSAGRIISPDRTHLTQAGARYIGQRALVGSRYGLAVLAAR